MPPIRLPVVTLACFLLASITSATVHAQSAKAGKQEATFSMAVSEGTSGGASPIEIIDRYKPIADAMSTALKTKVIVVPIRSFEELETGMKEARFNFVMARPSDYPARGLRDYKYQLVFTSRPDGQCILVTHKDSPLKSVKEVAGKNIIFPEKVAYMSRFCAAELRDQGIKVESEQVKYAREQGAIAWSVQNKLSDVAGVASYSGVGKNPGKSELKPLHKSRTQPFLPMIASPAVSSTDIDAVRQALQKWESSEDGKKTLAKLGIDGFNYESPERLLKLLVWLEAK